jgi:transposase
VTCWRRLRQWQALGIWATVHQVVLNWLGDLDAIDWSRASVDSVSAWDGSGGSSSARRPGSSRFRKLALRYDRHAAAVLAFLHLACALICLRFLARAETAAQGLAS